MAINDAVQLGWEYSAKHAGGAIGTFESSEYIAEVTDAIQKLNDDINFYAGRTDGVGTLKGFMAEEWHADTFNLNAILRGSANRAMRDDSNKHASVDISTNFGEAYSLKYYATGADSAKAQAKNVIEAYYEYCRKPRQGEPLSFEQYLDRYGYSEKDIYTSVYKNMRTIKQLISKENKVYFFMKDEDTCRRFYQDAEAESITFGGDKPTEKEPTDIIALLPDAEICYVGWAGHMCYYNCKEGVIRIDYEKYADGEDAFLIENTK